MKIAAIIAEYNPFHNGHKYQITQIKNEYNVDAVLVVLSGAFTQRGIPGIYDQHTRTKMALLGGADLVLELPIYYSTASAEYFARGAVTMLDKLGVVDNLFFGAESDDLELLKSTANALNNISSHQNEQIITLQNNGLSYPKARSTVLGLDGELINNPNNILAIEYLRELERRNSSIKPVSILRKGSGYNDSSLNKDSFSSAMAIRGFLESNKDSSYIKGQVPDDIFNLLSEPKENYPLFMNDFSDYLIYKLLEEQRFGFSKYFDVSEFLSNTFTNKLNNYSSFSQYIEMCKTKNYTYTRVNRCLTHIMLNLTNQFVEELATKDYILYARLLGFTDTGKSILTNIKEKSKIPLISKLSKANEQLSGLALESLEQDIFASNLYQSVKSRKYNIPFKNEYVAEIIKI